MHIPPKRVHRFGGYAKKPHIHFNGTHHFPEMTPQENFRPLREYQGSSAHRSLRQNSSKMPSGEHENTLEAVEDVIQLALLAEEEAES